MTDVTGNEPPTITVSGQVTVSLITVLWKTVLNRLGITEPNAEIEVFEGLPHGFGLGTGTVAEG